MKKGEKRFGGEEGTDALPGVTISVAIAGRRGLAAIVDGRGQRKEQLGWNGRRGRRERLEEEGEEEEQKETAEEGKGGEGRRGKARGGRHAEVKHR